jgi:hypothetical protein
MYECLQTVPAGRQLEWQVFRSVHLGGVCV